MTRSDKVAQPTTKDVDDGDYQFATPSNVVVNKIYQIGHNIGITGGYLRTASGVVAGLIPTSVGREV